MYLLKALLSVAPSTAPLSVSVSPLGGYVSLLLGRKDFHALALGVAFPSLCQSENSSLRTGQARGSGPNLNQPDRLLVLGIQNSLHTGVTKGKANDFVSSLCKLKPEEQSAAGQPRQPLKPRKHHRAG